MDYLTSRYLWNFLDQSDESRGKESLEKNIEWLMAIGSDELLSPQKAAFLARLVCKLHLQMNIAVRITYLEQNGETSVVEAVNGSLFSNSSTLIEAVGEDDLVNAIRPLVNQFVHKELAINVIHEEGQAWVTLETAPEPAGV